MQTNLKKLFGLAALTVCTLLSNVSSSHAAANCEDSLKPLYKCTATFEGGAPFEYCVNAYDSVRHDGRFLLDAGGIYNYCSCGAKGVDFGSTKDFFCDQADAGWAVSVGKVTGNKIKGQAYDLLPDKRAIFTCEAVASCP